MVLGETLGYYEEPGKTHLEGEQRVTRLPWTFWSLADLAHELPESAAMAPVLTVESPVSSVATVDATGHVTRVTSGTVTIDAVLDGVTSSDTWSAP